MALTPEQVKALKEQLISQVQNLPEDKKAEAIKQIESLSHGSLELMLQQQEGKAPKEYSIFRAIIDGEVPSVKVDENKVAIAVFEINPISRGHTIIIPKKPAVNPKDIPDEAFSLAKEVSKKITSELKASSTEIQAESKFGESIINIIPIYDKPLALNSPRKKASKEELEEILKSLNPIRKPKAEIIKKEVKRADSENRVLKLPRRIP